jgi:stringent starvation protein B
MRPYLIRALYEWCTDNGWTPYIAVQADTAVQVPREYVRNGQIILDISASATSVLSLDNDCIRFKARFGGVAREIIIPVDHVLAIYARENEQGMAFPAPEDQTAGANDAAPVEEVNAIAPHATADECNPPTANNAKPADGGIRLVSTAADAPGGDDDKPPPPPSAPRPALKRVK